MTQIKIVEVGPRDGLQNESQPVPVQTRIELIKRLADTGIPVIEAGAFVSPKWVPQMADTDQVMKKIDLAGTTHYPVLVPNMQGFEAARAAGAQEIAIFTAASETFCQKNINCTIDESFIRFAPVIEAAQASNIQIRGYVSCVLGCPYEGDITPSAVASVAARLIEAGCYEVSLGDTIGVGTPHQAKHMVQTVAERVPISKLAAHFHDTYGQALANLYAVLEKGITTIDSSVAGLGGCPYAPGASGNVATEDVVYMLDGLGLQTGIDIKALAQTGNWICQQIGRANRSKAGQGILSKS